MVSPPRRAGNRDASSHVVAFALALCVFLSGRALFVSGQELVSLQITFRHGDRSPIDIFPRHIQDWDFIVAGQLSEVGVRQHEAFGRYLRSLYLENTPFMNGLVTDVYDPERVYVRSTDVDRTIGSALAMLSTLYPDQAVPIPVRTLTPKTEDRLLRFWDNCPTYNAPRPRVSGELDVRARQEFAADDLTHIREVTGLDETIAPSEALLIRDCHDNIVGMRAHDIAVEDYLDQLSDRFDNFTKHYRYAQYIDRRGDQRDLGSLALQAQLRENLVAHRDAPGETPHLIFYSAHDNTLIGAFDIFGMVADEESDLLLPTYATSVVVELWHDNRKLLHEDGDEGPDYIRVRVGTPSLNSTSGEWSYDAEYSDFMCDGQMASQCALDVWIEQVDAMPTFAEGCCRQNLLFRESGCNNFFDDAAKEDPVCQSYRNNCPASGDMGVCGFDAIFSSEESRCVSTLTEAQTAVNTDEYYILLAVSIALAVILAILIFYWVYRSRKSKYNNLEETENLGRQREVGPGVVLGDRETRDGAETP